MIKLIQLATLEIARYLDAKLPNLSQDWWKEHVIARLTFHQQRMVQERGYSSLKQLDLAALLRLFDQNWFDLSNEYNLPREARSWIKEL